MSTNPPNEQGDQQGSPQQQPQQPAPQQPEQQPQQPAPQQPPQQQQQQAQRPQVQQPWPQPQQQQQQQPYVPQQPGNAPHPYPGQPGYGQQPAAGHAPQQPGYGAQPYPGQPYPNQPYPNQQYPGQQQPGYGYGYGPGSPQPHQAYGAPYVGSTPPARRGEPDGGSIWLGIGIMIALIILFSVYLFNAYLIPPGLSELIGFVLVIAGLGGGITLTCIRRTRRTGLGMLIGLAATPIIFFGVCTALLFGAAASSSI